jgi:hypothetical protein
MAEQSRSSSATALLFLLIAIAAVVCIFYAVRSNPATPSPTAASQQLPICLEQPPDDDASASSFKYHILRGQQVADVTLPKGDCFSFDFAPAWLRSQFWLINPKPGDHFYVWFENEQFPRGPYLPGKISDERFKGKGGIRFRVAGQGTLRIIKLKE